MMDLKEIIKWFIPCFHILLKLNRKMDVYLIVFCLLLFFNSNAHAATVSANNIDIRSDTKDVGDSVITRFNWMGGAFTFMQNFFGLESEGRTFGGPRIKKMIMSLIPLVFQIGAASTWAVVAAIIAFKTLLITMLILKMLLLAGAVKFGSLFAHKPTTHGWQEPHQALPTQKEIHLHIHNGNHETHESHDAHVDLPYSSWNRENLNPSIQKSDADYMNSFIPGPQTIQTPYGNYMRIDPNY